MQQDRARRPAQRNEGIDTKGPLRADDYRTYPDVAARCASRGVPMYHLSERIFTFLADESGQDIIEYALLAAFIGLGAILSTKSLAAAVTAVFANVGSILTTAT